MSDREHRETARRLAESVSSTLDDEKRAIVATHAVSLAEGLRDMCDSEMAGCRVAVTFVGMLSRLQRCEVSDIATVIDDTIASYCLAAGSLGGVYALPGREASSPSAPEAEAPELTGLYL